MTAASTGSLYTTAGLSSAIAVDPGDHATGKFSIDGRLCDISSKATVPRLLFIPSSGNVATPGHQGNAIEVDLSSQYYRKLRNGTKIHYPKGCRFSKATYEDATGEHAAVAAPGTLTVADGSPYEAQ